MQRYSSYKDSSVKWIGEIPEGWEVRKTLFCLSMPITDGPHETPQLHEDGIPFVSAEAVSCGNGRIDFDYIRGYISKEFYNECCKKYIPKLHDIYMIKSGATTGKVALVDTDRIFTIWSPLAVFRCDESIMYYDYMFYVLQSTLYQQQVQLGWSYGTQQNIGMRTLEKLKVPVPPLNEQQKIASFLDNIVGKIDEIIAQQQKMIDLLNERKQIIINNAVTKGLDPNVKMKDSGVEWIGEIPEKWEVNKFKAVAEVKANLVHPENYPNLYQIAPDNIYKNSGVLHDVKTVLDSGVISDNHLFHKGQILYSKIRPNLNKVAIAPYEGLCCADMYPIETKLNTEYLQKYMLSKCFTDQVTLVIMDRVKMPKINKEELAQILVICPTLEEQQQIVHTIDKEHEALDIAITNASRQISLLQERKQIIINEVVTGKVKVC